MAGRRVGHLFPVEVDQLVRRIPKSRREARPHPRLIQRKKWGVWLSEERALGVDRPDDQRYVGGNIRGGRIERIAWEGSAVHYWSEVERSVSRARSSVIDGRKQPIHRELLEFVHLVWLKAQFGEDSLCGLVGFLGMDSRQEGAAFDNRFVEQAFGGRHREQGADLQTAAGLAENRDIAGISAEMGDIVTHPLEYRHAVQQSRIA